MENEDQDIDFQASLEPDVIINDGSNEEYNNFTTSKKFRKSNFSRCIPPEISIIPVRKKASFKIKPPREPPEETQGNASQQTLTRSPRQTVRLISKEEATQAENSNGFFKRKSMPLEKCPVCKKYFRRLKTHLQKHESIKRDPNDPLTCQFCLKSFNTGSNLSIHMRTHTGDKPYRCEVCTKGFAQSCNLVNHMRIHTGERPFKCPYCDRAFTQSGNLSNHIRLHTDEKPFKCHFCDKAFTQSGNLNSHIRNNHKFLDNVRPIVKNVQ